MKISSLFICISLFWTFQTNAQSNTQKDYQINGTFNGLQSGIIKMYSEDGQKVLDSAVIKNNKFTFQGKIGLPEQRGFLITPGIWSFKGIVESGNLTFTIDSSGAQHIGKIGKGGHTIIWQIKEAGSAMAEVYQDYSAESNMMETHKLAYSLQDSLRKMQGNESAQNSIKKGVDSLIKSTLSKQKMFMEKYINKHPSSVAGVFLLTDYYRNSEGMHLAPNSLLQETLKKFSGQAKRSIYYQRLAQKRDALKNLSVNASAPDFTIPKNDSTRFTLSSLKGNYVLLDFWASWCGPCRAAIPHLKDVYKNYASKGLKIVSISIDKNRRDWQKAMEKEQMPWIQTFDEQRARNVKKGLINTLYYTPSIPFFVLIDKAGKIISTSNNEAEISDRITQLIK